MQRQVKAVFAIISCICSTQTGEEVSLAILVLQMNQIVLQFFCPLGSRVDMLVTFYCISSVIKHVIIMKTKVDIVKVVNLCCVKTE